MPTLSPEVTYAILLVVQALHLLHHRLAKRHISFVEVGAAGVLCTPLAAPVPGWLLMGVQLGLAAVQIVGNVYIRRFSPEWEPANSPKQPEPIS